MRKNFCLVMILAVAMIFSLVPIFADDAVTLKVYDYLDMSSPSAPAQTGWWKTFQDANPNIKLDIEYQFNEPFHQKLQGYIAADQFPDIIYMWPGGRSTSIHTQHLVKDLTPFLGSLKKEYTPATFAPQAGGYFGEFPICVTATNVLFANKKMLSDMKLSMPKTYKDLVSMSKKLKAAGKDTILVGSQDAWVMQCVLFSTIVGRLCGDDFIAKVKNGQAKFTDPTFMKALNFYAQMFKDGVLDKKIFSISYGDVNPLWASGKAPIMIDGDWKTGNFLTDPTTKQALIPVKDQSNFAMTLLPSIPGEINHNTTSVAAGTGYGMSAKIPAPTAKEKAAWKLITWMVSAEVEKSRLEIGLAFPNRIGVTSDKLEPLGQERARFSTSPFNATCVLDDKLDASVVSPINTGIQEIGIGTSTPQQVAEAAQKALDAWRATQK
jgi:raffinose/stachyose/melibiose transport system substrate-binding protein